MRGQSINWKAWTAGVVLLAAAIGWWALHWRPNATDYPVQGVDVSADEGDIDIVGGKLAGGGECELTPK